jgi:protein-S-isoprenylcysteine O-methyltransferase Ste14
VNASFCHIALGALWAVWFYPFLFRAPLRQKRANITVAAPTRIGLLCETSAIVFALVMHRPLGEPIAPAGFIAAVILAAVAIRMAFGAVKHLGRQFRLHAGLYHDHELVRTGPYALVRHPIYAALLAMLLATILIVTPWKWAAVSLLVYITGTEIRVRSEEKLLAARFGHEFRAYQSRVPAYIPFVR